MTHTPPPEDTPAFVDAYNRKIRADGLAGTITSRVDASNMVFLLEPNKEHDMKEKKIISHTRDHKDGKTRTFHTKDISNTLHASNFENTRQYVLTGAYRIRKLTPRECFRLMDVSEADIDKIQEAGISNSQQYKMAGNSIVVNVLAEIFRKMFVETEQEEKQQMIF